MGQKQRKGFRTSLQLKLTIFFVLGVIISVGVVSYTSLTSMQNNLEREVEKNQMLLAQAFGAQVEQYFSDAKGVVSVTAQLPVVRDMSYVGLISENIMGVPREADVPKRAVINSVLEEYGQFGYMEQVTATGDNIVIEPWEYQLDLQRLNFSDRDWFRGALTTRGAYISEVYVSSSLQKPVIAISHPVMDDRGNVSAVWMGALTLDKLSELSHSLTFGETGHAYLVDQNGILAAFKDFALVQEMRDISTAPAVQRVLRGEAGTESLMDPMDQRENLTSYMPIASTGWGIIVVQDPDEAFAPIRATMTLALTVGVVLLVIAVVVAIFVARSISHPVSELALAAGKVAEGDLTATIEIKSKDEVGELSQAFGKMVSQMREVVMEIMNKANVVASASEDLSASAEETAASASQTSATMNEISSTVEQVSSSVREVSALSESAAGQAGEGRKGVARVIEQMQAIAHTSDAVSDTIDGLDKQLQQIRNIVELITGIADQTNLLALNAAIEAARAGEQGRGFAVVADEVRKLAEQSAGAATDIHTLINAILSESQRAVGTMADGNREVAVGTEVVNEVGNNFQAILESVQQLTAEIGEVASATEQMSSGVQNIAASSEEQTATMEEVSASAESLTQLSEELSNLIQRFDV